MIKFLINLFKGKRGRGYEIERDVIDENATLVRINAEKPLSEKELLKIIKEELINRRRHE